MNSGAGDGLALRSASKSLDEVDDAVGHGLPDIAVLDEEVL